MYAKKILAGTVGMASFAGIAAALTSPADRAAGGSVVVVSGAPRNEDSSFAAASQAASPSAAAVSVNSFSPSNVNYPNPERGFYRWIANGDLDAWTQADADNAYNNGFRLVFARINLANYRGTDTLPTAYLNSLRTAFGYARSAGVKIIVRAVYNYPQGEENYENAQDASLSRVQAHLNQLKPVLQDNGDVIAFVQAGFIGAWGEWHTSSNGLTNDPARTAVKDALLAAVPASRFVQFRYPYYIKPWAQALPTLDAAVANNFRLGFHNDCFLASASDVGTYHDGQNGVDERNYAKALGDIAPVGGETCNSRWDSTAVRRSSCSDIESEGADYNFTYLNIDYWREDFHDRWVAGNCMSTVQNRMGYRFALKTASHDAAVARGASFQMTFTIENSGWARLYNERPVQLVLQNASTSAVQRLTATGSDPRKWKPGQTTATVNASVPSGLAPGTYKVLLALPDKALTNNPRFSIRFANENNGAANQYWDSNLGAFFLGTTVNIS